jgi:hypothetical protein
MEIERSEGHLSAQRGGMGPSNYSVQFYPQHLRNDPKNRRSCASHFFPPCLIHKKRKKSPTLEANLVKIDPGGECMFVGTNACTHQVFMRVPDANRASCSIRHQDLAIHTRNLPAANRDVSLYRIREPPQQETTPHRSP